ncbi:hypothetical protein JCM3774_005812 [Rhodotorula dairenensis]
MPPPYSPQANEALLAFVFVKNRSPHAALTGGVPLAVWRGKPVRVDMLRVWGGRAYHAITNGRAKLDDKANEYNVFHPVDRREVPPDTKILGARFVYRRKKDQNGQVNGHKVRLVAQGFTQRPNVNFRETFAPVVKVPSIRVLLALAACHHRLHVLQADVDKVYLHGALEEELYMRVPEGVDGSEYAGKVLKLDRALYGLKQAGRVWNHRIYATLEVLGYRRTKSDACIYVRSEGGHTHYIALYIDNLLFVSPDLDEIQWIKDGLKRRYGIKDLGEAKFILGIQVHRRSNGGLFLYQRAYLEDVLLRLGYADG